MSQHSSPGNGTMAEKNLFAPDAEAPDPFATERPAHTRRPGIELFDSFTSTTVSASDSFATANDDAEVLIDAQAALRAESGESEAPRRAATVADVRAAYDGARWLAAAALIEQLPPREQLSAADAAYLAGGVEDDARAAVRVRDALALRADAARRAGRPGGASRSTRTASRCTTARRRARRSSRSRSRSTCPRPRATSRRSCTKADLLPAWLPSVLGIDCAVLGRGMFRELVYMKAYLPPPFANRYAVFDAMAVDAVDETGGFLIVVRSEDDAEERRAARAAGLGARRGARAHHGRGRGRHPGRRRDDGFANVMNMDLDLGYFVPVSIINFLTRKLVWYAFAAFSDQMTFFTQNGGLTDDYRERVENENAHVYEVDRPAPRAPAAARRDRRGPERTRTARKLGRVEHSPPPPPSSGPPQEGPKPRLRPAGSAVTANFFSRLLKGRGRVVEGAVLPSRPWAGATPRRLKQTDQPYTSSGLAAWREANCDWRVAYSMRPVG